MGERGNWLPFDAEEGYPTDEWLDHFQARAYCPGEAARFLVRDLPEIAKHISCLHVAISEMPDNNMRHPGYVVFYATGGWSGAESLIEAMLDHFWIKQMHSKWERGGAFWFEVPQSWLDQPANPQTALASTPSRSERE